MSMALECAILAHGSLHKGWMEHRAREVEQTAGEASGDVEFGEQPELRQLGAGGHIPTPLTFKS